MGKIVVLGIFTLLVTVQVSWGRGDSDSLPHILPDIQHPASRFTMLLQYGADLWGTDTQAGMKHAKEAFSIAEKTSDGWGKAQAQLLLGRYYTLAGDMPQAHAQLTSAQQFFQQTSDPLPQAKAHHYLGELYRILNKYSRSLDELTQAGRLYRLAGNYEAEASAQLEIAQVYIAWGKFDTAQEYVEKVLPIAEDQVSPILLFKSKCKLAIIQRNLGNYRQALDLLPAPNSQEKGAVPPLRDQAWAQHEHAINIGELGKFDESLRLQEQCLKMFTRLQDQLGMADTYFSMAYLAYYKSDYLQTKSYFLSALTVYENLQATDRVINCLNGIGKMYHKMGAYEEASKNFYKALTLKDSTESPLGLSYAYLNLAQIELKLKNPKKAFTLSQLAQENERPIGRKLTLGIIHSFQAQLNLELGHQKEALKQAQQALNINRNLGRQLGIAHGLCLMGKIYAKDQSYGQAYRYYQNAYHSFENLGNWQGQASCQLELGKLFLKQNRPRSAFEALTQSIKIAETIEANSLTMEAHHYMATTYEKMGDFTKAYHASRKHQSLKEHLFNQEKLKEVADMAYQYDILTEENKLTEQQLRVEQQKTELLNEKHKMAKRTRNLLIAVIVLLAAVAWLFYNRNQLKSRANASLEKANRDILAANQQLLTYNQELEQFAYIATHDLKDPLNSVDGFSRLLQKKYKEALGPEGMKFLKYIQDGNQRMLRLTTDLMAYMRSRKMAVNMEQVDVERIIRDLRTHFLRVNPEAEIRILPLPHIIASKFHVQKVFENLISNGLKFMKPGVSPVVEVGSKEEFGSYLLYVKDNGIGIAREHQEKIFDIFKRLHSKEEYNGTGIGLAICAIIIDQYNGEVWVESQPGNGSTFYIRFPKNPKKNSFQPHQQLKLVNQ